MACTVYGGCRSMPRTIRTLHGSGFRPSIGLQTVSVRSGRSTHRLTCASWSTLGTTYSAGRAMAARKLTYRQIADLLLDLECGTTGFAAAASYGISPAAVSLWKPYVGLDEKWLAHVKRLEHETTILRRRVKYAEGQIGLAGSIIKQLEQIV